MKMYLVYVGALIALFLYASGSLNDIPFLQ